MDPMKCNTILSVSDDEKVSALKSSFSCLYCIALKEILNKFCLFFVSFLNPKILFHS